MTGNPETENALRSILEEVEKKFEPLRTKQNETYWKAAISGTAADFQAAEQAELEYRLNIADSQLHEELKKYLSDSGVQDLLLRRWANLIRLEITPHLLEEEVVQDLVTKEKNLEAKVNSFRAEVAGEHITQNRVAEILRHSDDPEFRRCAWEASKELGVAIKEDLYNLVKARNLAARSLGYPDYYRMNFELQEIDETRLFSNLGTFAAASEDLYRRKKAKLDRILADKFKIDVTDLEPWHYGDLFFQEAPPVYGADSDPVYQGRSTLDWVRKYFEGIGLPIDSILEKGDYFEHEGKDPTAFCIDIDRKGDVRTLLNLRDNTYWAGTAMHEFGHAVFDLNIDRTLPHTLRRAAHQSVTEGVAMFFERNIRDIEWMMEEFHLPGPQVRELEGPLQEERRLQMSIMARWSLVMIHFERGLYRDPEQDQQNRWWDLVQRFQLITRPKNRTDKADWATKAHIAVAPVYYQNYILGEWMASMFHYKMREDLGMEEPVVWHNDHRVGEWFRENVFKPGATWHYSELIRNVMGAAPRPHEFVDQFLVDHRR